MRAVCLSWCVLLLPQTLVLGQTKTGGPDSARTVHRAVLLLRSKDIALRAWAITELSKAGPRATAAVPELLRVFREEESSLLHPLAAIALARIGGKALPHLEKALGDRSPQVRAGAALALGLMGVRARPMRAALKRLLFDRDRLVRTAAAGALEGVDPPPRREPVLLDSSDEPDPEDFPPEPAPRLTPPRRDATRNALIDEGMKIENALAAFERLLRTVRSRPREFLKKTE